MMTETEGIIYFLTVRKINMKWWGKLGAGHRCVTPPFAADRGGFFKDRDDEREQLIRRNTSCCFSRWLVTEEGEG